MIKTVHQLIQHNEKLMDQTNAHMKEKYKDMEKHIKKQDREKELMVENLNEATKQMEIANNKTANTVECKCSNASNESVLKEVRENQEKLGMSQQNWNQNITNIINNIEMKIDSVENDIQNFNHSPPHSDIRQNGTTPQQPSLLKPSYDMSKPTVLIVIDSNGKHIRKDELFHGKNVIMEKRSTAKEALNNTPTLNSPTGVSDIVILTGLNDSKSFFEKVETTTQTQLDIITKYSKTFVNAKFHLGCVPPSSNKQERLNVQLEELALRLGIQFISPKPMYDRTSRKLRSGILEEDTFHYTELGIRTLAKEIKKSLHSKYDPNSQNWDQLSQPQSNVATPLMPPEIMPQPNPLLPRTAPSNPLPPRTAPSSTHPLPVLYPSSTSQLSNRETLDQLLKGMSELIKSVSPNLA